MSESDENPFAAVFEGLPDDPDQLTVIDEVRLLGRFVWELTSRSLGRLVFTFLAVFVASWLPAALITFGLTYATQTYTRVGLLTVAAVCLIPLAALVSFNYVAYRGLRDIVEKLAFGQKIGAGLVAFIGPADHARIPLDDFTERLKTYLSKTRAEVSTPDGRFKRVASRVINATIFYAARFTLNRIAKDCVVDGQVDLERFASGVGERADGMLISYFKKLLWDLTRVFLSVAVLLLWLLIVVVTQLVKLIP